MIQPILINIAKIGYVLLFLNIAFYFLEFKKKIEKPYKIFSLYLLSLSLIQMGAEYYLKEGGKNLFLTHYYFIIQSLFLSVFYYFIIQSQKIKKLIKTVVLITLISLTIQYYLYPKLYYLFNVYEIFICIIPIVIYALSHLFQTLGNPNKKYIYITSGVLIYFLPHALVFSSGNLMPDLPANINQILWLLNAILYVFFLILIFVEWYKNFRKKDTVVIPTERQSSDKEPHVSK
mgnify:CR=1 FL=1